MKKCGTLLRSRWRGETAGTTRKTGAAWLGFPNAYFHPPDLGEGLAAVGRLHTLDYYPISVHIHTPDLGVGLWVHKGLDGLPQDGEDAGRVDHHEDTQALRIVCAGHLGWGEGRRAGQGGCVKMMSALRRRPICPDTVKDACI